MRPRIGHAPDASSLATSRVPRGVFDCPAHQARAEFSLPLKAGVSLVEPDVPAPDEEGASCWACIALLLARKSERVRHARYVRELASETTK